MNKKTKKNLVTAGIAAAAVIIVIVAALLIRGCAMDEKYTENYENARSAYLAGEYDAALRSLEAAIKIKGTDQGYLLMADIYVAKGEHARAVETLRLALYGSDSRAIRDMLAELEAAAPPEDAEETADIGGENVPLGTTSLILPDMGISDISNIPRLESLSSASLQGNAISDLSPLRGMTGLTFLDLRDNEISDISPLSGLTGLKTLYLDGNRVESYAALYSLTGLTTLSIKDMEISEAALLNLKKSLPGCGIYADEAETEAKELTLGGKTFMSDAAELDLSGLGIDDLSVLEQCGALTALNLNDNDIADLTPLMNLPGLTRLELRGNEITDIRPLMSVPGLTYLDLAGNGLSDISPLAFLPELTELYLGGSEPASVRALGGLEKLKKLSLNDTGLRDSDLDALKNLKNLSALNIEDNEKLSSAGVEALKAALPGCAVAHSDLRGTVVFGSRSFGADDSVIDAPNSGISDISGLEGFSKVKKLLLSDNTISDISVLKNMPELEVVELRRLYGSSPGGIADISALSGLRSLRSLNLSSNSVSDLTPLASCTALTELHLNGNKISDISALASLSSLTVLSLGYNDISDLSPLSGLTGLKNLSLDGNSFTDITALRSLSSLTTLSLMDTGLSANQIAELQAALPNCTIDANAA